MSKAMLNRESSMDVFSLRDHLIQDYHGYSSSFIQIRDPYLQRFVNKELGEGLLWPEPLIQINPNYKQCATVVDLADAGVLHSLTAKIFHVRDKLGNLVPLRLHKHQQDALALGQEVHRLDHLAVRDRVLRPPVVAEAGDRRARDAAIGAIAAVPSSSRARRAPSALLATGTRSTPVM